MQKYGQPPMDILEQMVAIFGFYSSYKDFYSTFGFLYTSWCFSVKNYVFIL